MRPQGLTTANTVAKVSDVCSSEPLRCADAHEGCRMDADGQSEIQAIHWEVRFGHQRVLRHRVGERRRAERVKGRDLAVSQCVAANGGQGS
jgi:hypothetical protein